MKPHADEKLIFVFVMAYVTEISFLFFDQSVIFLNKFFKQTVNVQQLLIHHQ